MIIRNLVDSGKQRFTDFLKTIPAISKKVLTDNLRALEDDGLIERKVFAEVPPRVEYSLSPIGISLKPISTKCRPGVRNINPNCKSLFLRVCGIIDKGDAILKKLLTLKILLPVFACLLIALLVFQIKCLDFHNDGENGLIFIVAILVNIIPMFAMVILGFICVVLYVLLLTLRNKRGVIKGLLVVLCVMVPFVAFNAVIDIMALSVYAEVPILACVALATNIATLIMCPLALREIAN